ncbi:MAG: exodeoxyribonuclease VII small subunit [Desulfovibrio sp.]|uniref:exodeoxyribonuclease VII small subunit n=1 Tax=Desulfovibrio sp. 7SRBS1 TaxID=3378064 RepID=UPI003B3BFF56
MSEKTNFEDQLARLRTIVDALENGELPLEQGVALYKEGLSLAKSCRTTLENAKNEVTMYQEGLLTQFSPVESENDD